jgi:hypothetical protein
VIEEQRADPATKSETCVCQSCESRFEFKVEQSGQTVECRFCGKPTVLYKTPISLPSKKSPKKSNAPAITGVVAVVMLLVVVLAVRNLESAWISNESFAVVVGAVFLFGTGVIVIVNRSER